MASDRGRRGGAGVFIREREAARWQKRTEWEARRGRVADPPRVGTPQTPPAPVKPAKFTLEDVIVHLSRLTERTMSVDRSTTGDAVIVQRCRACKEEVATRSGWDIADPASVARRVQHDYTTHVCKPIRGELDHFTDAELESMYQATEAESVRLAERADEIKRKMAERASKGG